MSFFMEITSLQFNRKKVKMTMQAVIDSLKLNLGSMIDEYFLGVYCFYDFKLNREITSTEFDTLEDFFYAATESNSERFCHRIYCHIKSFGEIVRVQYFNYDEVSLEELNDEFFGHLKVLRTQCSEPNGWVCNFESFNVIGDGTNHAHGNTIQEAIDNFVSLNNNTGETLFYTTSKFGPENIPYTTSIRCKKLKFDNK